MGGNQSIPKITSQDRAVLEYVSLCQLVAHELIDLKSKTPARQTETISEEGMSITLPGFFPIRFL
jgi:hypothetical protein